MTTSEVVEGASATLLVEEDSTALIVVDDAEAVEAQTEVEVLAAAVEGAAEVADELVLAPVPSTKYFFRIGRYVE